MPTILERGSPDDLPEALRIDEDATLLYARNGLSFGLPPDHPFLADEPVRWRRWAQAGGLWFARLEGERVGFAALGEKDGMRYLDQLSVHTAAQRRGIGRALVEHVQAIARAEGRALVLTTYAHVPWNAPFYERCGFRALEPSEHGPGVRATLDAERAALPRPEQRVAMRWAPRG